MKQKQLSVFTIFIFSLLLISCPNLFNDPYLEAPKDLPPGMGFVVLSVKGEGRAIIPDKPIPDE